MNLLVNLTVVFCCCVISTRTIMAMKVGGITDTEKEPNDEVQQLLSSLSSEIKSAALATLVAGSDGPSDDLKQSFQSANVTGLGHKTQLVAGVNYFVRTQIGDSIFHVRIYKDLKQNASLSKVVGPKKETDPIQYF